MRGGEAKEGWPSPARRDSSLAFLSQPARTPVPVGAILVLMEGGAQTIELMCARWRMNPLPCARARRRAKTQWRRPFFSFFFAPARRSSPQNLPPLFITHLQPDDKCPGGPPPRPASGIGPLTDAEAEARVPLREAGNALLPPFLVGAAAAAGGSGGGGGAGPRAAPHHPKPRTFADVTTARAVSVAAIADGGIVS